MSYDAWKTTEPDEPRWVTPQRTVKVCIECEGIATDWLSGRGYCFDHFREQQAVVMGLMQEQRYSEKAGK